MTAVGKMLSAAAIAIMAASANAQTPAVKNVVLVHGAFADGSGWRGVYDELTSRGYRVSIRGGWPKSDRAISGESA